MSFWLYSDSLYSPCVDIKQVFCNIRWRLLWSEDELHQVDWGTTAYVYGVCVCVCACMCACTWAPRGHTCMTVFFHTAYSGSNSSWTKRERWSFGAPAIGLLPSGELPSHWAHWPSSCVMVLPPFVSGLQSGFRLRDLFAFCWNGAHREQPVSSVHIPCGYKCNTRPNK